MLALHDWGNCAGQKSWVTLGVSIRYAQALGLQYQLDLDDEPQSSLTMLPPRMPYVGSSGNLDATQSFVEEETKRRVFWGLFVMDRYLSSGKYRPQMVKVEDIRIQLPSSERSFMFKERVRTSMLSDSLLEMDTHQDAHGRRPDSPQHNASGARTSNTTNVQIEDLDRFGRWETGLDEGIVSRYIRAIDLYGKIIRWSCRGGRR
jgi:hypothetical protein